MLDVPHKLALFQMCTSKATMIPVLNPTSSIAKPTFNRWLIPPAAMALQLCLGQAYALSALFLPVSGTGAVQQSRAWIDGTLGTVFTLAIVMLGLSAAFAGRLTAAIGARAVAYLATLFFCSGLVLAGIAVEMESFPLFLIGYGVIGGIGLGLGYVAPIQMLIDWFPERRGLSTGLAITGFGGGAMLATALSSFLIGVFQSDQSTGVGQTLIALALIYAVIMLVASSGFKNPAAAGNPAAPSMDAATALRKPQFYLLWCLVLINVVTGINLLSSAPGVLTLAMGRDALAFEIAGFVALLSLSNMAGRFVISAASDHIDRNHTVMLLLIIGCLLHLSMPYLASRMNLPLTVMEYMLMIMVYGGLFAIIPGYVADVFGAKSAGAIHGRILTAWSVGAIVAAAGAHLLSSKGMSVSDTRDLQLEIVYATSVLFLIALAINFAIRPAVAPAAPAAVEQTAPPSVPAESRGLFRAWGALGVLLLAGIAWTLYRAAELPLSWQIGATLLPLILGAAVCISFYYFDRSRYAVRGVAGPYFAALALLFGLYASLMANEVWQKTSHVNDLLDTEVSALNSLTSIAHSVAPGDGRVVAAVQSFTEALIANDRLPPSSDGPEKAIEAPLQQLYAIGADADFFKGHAPQNSSFMTALETLRFSHLERSKLRSQSRDNAKLVILLIFGVLTQIAIAFCHAGNQRAISATVMLFSVGFSVSVAAMALLDGAIRFADAVGVVPAMISSP